MAQVKNRVQVIFDDGDWTVFKGVILEDNIKSITGITPLSTNAGTVYLNLDRVLYLIVLDELNTELRDKWLT